MSSPDSSTLASTGNIRDKREQRHNSQPEERTYSVKAEAVSSGLLYPTKVLLERQAAERLVQRSLLHCTDVRHASPYASVLTGYTQSLTGQWMTCRGSDNAPRGCDNTSFCISTTIQARPSLHSTECTLLFHHTPTCSAHLFTSLFIPSYDSTTCPFAAGTRRYHDNVDSGSCCCPRSPDDVPSTTSLREISNFLSYLSYLLLPIARTRHRLHYESLSVRK